MLPSREFTWKSAKCGARRDVHTVLNSQVLVLNRLWQAVNICSARRAFALVYAGHAQIVSSDEANNFLTNDFESWRDLSANAPDHEVVTTISSATRTPVSIAANFSIAASSISITSCRAIAEGRLRGRMWFARAFL